MAALVFRVFVEHILVPVLRPNNVVILDNAKVHYDEDTIDMIENTGAGVMYLPPYSPELNPIENIWSKAKSYLKKIPIFDKEHLYLAIADSLNIITSSDARNSFIHCL